MILFLTMMVSELEYQTRPCVAVEKRKNLWNMFLLRCCENCENEEARTVMLNRVSNTFKSQCKMNKKN